jgi:hypothetical protein
MVNGQSAARWSRIQLIAFRFAFVFTALSYLHLSIVIPTFLFFDALARPVQAVVIPAATNELRASMTLGGFVIARLSSDPSSLHDLSARYMGTLLVLPDPANTRMSALAEMLGLTIAGALVAAIWSVADRRRASYEGLCRGMRVVARYMLALTAMIYATVKVVPTQFGFLAPGELLRPIGQLSPARLMWDYMAASTFYTLFTGFVEIIAVSLLFFRRTAMAGALLIGAALTNIIVMDVGYRIGAGALNVALLMLALDAVVLLPYAPALASFLFLKRATTLPQEPGVLSHPWRYSAVVSALVLALLVTVRVQAELARRHTYLTVLDRPVWGMFRVENFARNGLESTRIDGTAWSRLATGSPAGGRVGAGLTVMFADGDVRQYPFTDDTRNHVWTMRQGTREIGTLRYVVESDGTVAMEGRLGQDPVTMRLRRVDPADFPLLQR